MIKKNQAGFTMIEMLVVMVVLSVLATIAIPTFSRWYPNYRLRTTAREIYSTIQTAKMTAVKENTNVVVWFDKDNDTFGAFVDTNGDNSKDGGERSLKDGTIHEDVDLYDIADFGLGDLTYFDTRGLAEGGWGNIKLRRSDDPNSRIMRIGIWLSGTVEISESTDGGASWEDLGDAIIEGEYNDTISTSFSNPIGGQAAWSGESGATMILTAHDPSFASLLCPARAVFRKGILSEPEPWPDRPDHLRLCVNEGVAPWIRQYACALVNSTT